jgi:hypothetical protein
MVETTFDYPRWIAEALVDVARRALRVVAEDGLPGVHHFYRTLRTDAPGVLLPQSLRNRFPQEMTIVLQHQFWGLAVTDEAFSVSLRFSGARQQITVPFAALIAFADPSVELGLRFRPSAAEAGAPSPTPRAGSPTEPDSGPETPKASQASTNHSVRGSSSTWRCRWVRLSMRQRFTSRRAASNASSGVAR